MSHQQAYHTSCQDGLGGHSGFQFNAASPGITAQRLSQLAAAHAGYHAPRDLPREPTRQELTQFPTSLKSLAVDGTPVVSQTVYVGREFRGIGGEPDSGRFGNYFSHIVLADTADAEPFDGLLPIELWKAAHWCSEESAEPELPNLEALTPGRPDLQWALELLPDPRDGWHAALLGGALAAISGGPRVVLVEADNERAAAWVAWVSFALPPDLAPRLSFTTFEGQPRHAHDVLLCVTTPGCDLAFAEHELGYELLLLDPASGQAPATHSLYGAVAAEIARDGANAVAGAVTGPSDGDADRRGAQLALRTGLVRLAAERHVPPILDVLLEMARAGRWEEVVCAAEQLPGGPPSEVAVRGWWSLHGVAREATAATARGVADAALEHLVQPELRLPDDVSRTPPDSPTSPSPGLLAEWLGQVEAASSGPVRAARLDTGLQLGLVGCNVALDRRVASAIAELVHTPEVKESLVTLAASGVHDSLVEAVVTQLACDAFAEEAALPRLREVVSEPTLTPMVDRLAEQSQELDQRVVWEQLRVEEDPTQLRDALATLVPIAVREGRAAELTRLFGRDGPVRLEDHKLLLEAFHSAGLGAPDAFIDGALGALSELPLTDTARGRPLLSMLRSTASQNRLRDPLCRAWTVACTQPQRNFVEWCNQAAEAAVAPPELLPDDRFVELRELAGRAAVTTLATPLSTKGAEQARAGRDGGLDGAFEVYCEGVELLAGAFGPDWPEVVSRALSDEMAKARDRAFVGAAAFLWWAAMPNGTGNLSETALPLALETQSARRIDAIEEKIPEESRASFARWLESHPPAGGGVARLLRRGSR